jgi:hypothetical protein
MRIDLLAAAAGAALLAAASAASAQPATEVAALAPMAAPVAPAPVAAAVTAAAVAPGAVTLAEGSEVVIRINEAVSSGTNVAGDTFEVSLAEPVRLSDGTILAAGYRGRGEVVYAKRRGHMGRAGELNVRLAYLRVGPDRIPLRASKSSEGKGSLGSAVALTVLFGPVGLLARGADITIAEGQTMNAYVDQDVALTTPITAQ